jgi:NodT family efflux transporter outer membrane factor (OMF) lipoprotein
MNSRTAARRPRFASAIAASLASLFLIGCMGPRPPMPAAAAVAAPPAWRVDQGPTAPIEIDWWTRYGDPQLSALVAQALANNADVGIAAARVQEALAQERVARAQLWPSLDFSAPASRAHSLNAFGQARSLNSAQPTLTVAYELDLFARVTDLANAAHASALSAQAARDAALLLVAAATARAYITLRALDAQLDVVRQTLVSRDAALRLARSRADTGYTSQLEFEQARAEYESTAQAVPQAELAVTRQENALSVLVGAVPSAAIRRGAPLNALQQPAVPAVMPADMLRRRPDLAQAEFDLAATDVNLSAARKAFLPRVQLTATGGLLYASGLANPLTVWSLGGSVLAPIFEAGRIAGAADAAAARRDQAAFAYRRVALTAFREVNDNLAAVDRLGTQVERLSEQRDALVEALRHATNRYKAGYAPYLDQLDAQRQLFNAELNLIQARSDRLNASVLLYQAMGGGWQSGLDGESLNFLPSAANPTSP